MVHLDDDDLDFPALDYDSDPYAERLAEIQAEYDRRALAKVLRTEEGRAVVWKLLADAGLLQLSFDGDPNWAIWRDGRRSIATSLLANVFDADDTAFDKMRAESQQRLDLHASQARVYS